MCIWEVSGERCLKEWLGFEGLLVLMGRCSGIGEDCLFKIDIAVCVEWVQKLLTNDTKSNNYTAGNFRGVLFLLRRARKRKINPRKSV